MMCNRNMLWMLLFQCMEQKLSTSTDTHHSSLINLFRFSSYPFFGLILRTNRAKEILFTKASLNKFMADYCDQPVEKIAADVSYLLTLKNNAY
jgi:hypothetical protein